MLRSFVKNSFIYYLSNVLTKGISFFLLPFYTMMFSQGDYGILEMISVLSTFAIVIFSLQIQEGVGRYYNELSSASEIRIYTSTVAYFVLSSFSGFFMLTLVFANQLSSLISVNSELLVLAAASISLNGIFYFSQNQLTWKILPLKQMICALVYNLTTISLTILLVLKFKYGIESIFISQIIGAFIGTSLGWFFTRQDFGIVFSPIVLKKLLHFSLPMVPNAIGIYVFLIIDRFCIEHFVGLEQLGLYSFSLKMASILSIVHLGMSTALAPLIYKHYKESDTPQKINSIFRYFSFLSFLAIAFIGIFSLQLTHFLAGRSGYENAILYVPILLITLQFASLNQFFPGLIIAKKTKIISVISIGTGILNLAINLLLIPNIGILGACIAGIISTTLNLILIRHFASKEYYIPLSMSKVFFNVIVILLIAYSNIYYQLVWGIEVLLYVLFVIFTSMTFLNKHDLILGGKLIKSWRNHK